MSGIYGMVRYDGTPVTAESLAPMSTAMSFWGSDGHGQWCGEDAGLGHLMLHVTPESLAERQPASIRIAPHLIITADARIDNREELFNALGVPGPGREQTPDSSLILLAYERWGQDCVKQLLGDFAFAIWNSRERRLFCARDPFGCKPFVYHHDGRRFIFASDVKGVLARVESPRLNDPLLATYLQMKTYHAEKALTFFENVVKLQPAHTLTLTASGLQLLRYWSPEDAPSVQLATDADYAEQMRHLFQQSVQCRLRSAFSIGSHLSGGMDSSSISIVAARQLRESAQELAVFSWSPRPQPGMPLAGEYVRIEEVCRHEGLRCQYVPPTVESVMKTFQIDFTVEPTSMLAREANVQRLARAQGLRVMLSGWGGDEAVSTPLPGYLTELYLNNNWAELRKVVGLHLGTAGRGDWPLKAWRFGGAMRQLAFPLLPDFIFSLAVERDYGRHHASCVQPAFARLHQRAVKEMRGPLWRSHTRARETIGFYLNYGNVPMRLEHWAASGARHSIDYRYPMLDKRLVEFVLGVHFQQLSGRGREQSLFRRMVTTLLPSANDWTQVKIEPGSFGAVKQVNFEAHSTWVSQLSRCRATSKISHIIDSERLNRVIRLPNDPSSIILGGVREAFCCYTVAALM